MDQFSLPLDADDSSQTRLTRHWLEFLNDLVGIESGECIGRENHQWWIDGRIVSENRELLIGVSDTWGFNGELAAGLADAVDSHDWQGRRAPNVLMVGPELLTTHRGPYLYDVVGYIGTHLGHKRWDWFPAMLVQIRGGSIDICRNFAMDVPELIGEPVRRLDIAPLPHRAAAEAFNFANPAYDDLRDDDDATDDDDSFDEAA